MGPGLHARVLIKQACLYLTERRLFKTTTDASNFSLLRVGARGRQQRLCQWTHKSPYCSFLLTKGSRLGVGTGISEPLPGLLSHSRPAVDGALLSRHFECPSAMIYDGGQVESEELCHCLSIIKSV